MTATVQKLEQVFREALELPADASVSDLEQATTSQWDSLAHVRLMIAIESEFEVTLDTLDALRVTSFETARALLSEHGL